MDDLEEALLLIKHQGFADERETRYCVVLMARPEEAAALEIESRLLVHRATVYGIAPYLRLTGCDPARPGPLTSAPNPLPIRAVSVSPSPNGPAAEESVRRLLTAHGYRDVPVVRSGIPFRG